MNAGVDTRSFVKEFIHKLLFYVPLSCLHKPFFQRFQCQCKFGFKGATKEPVCQLVGLIGFLCVTQPVSCWVGKDV